MALDTHEWWQKGIIYQVYPRSFSDADGDGVGDLNGVRSKLDYVEWLGVDAVWLSPIYPSPMADFGYDISDYCGIHPLFGTLEDFDALLSDVHALGMHLVLDLVPNHSSDEHAWFIESRQSRTNPKRDWYIWQDPGPNGGPPNNWLSNFGGSAWQFDEATGQYYYHAFLAKQPDLNWRNREVRAAMYDAMRFWLDRGVDGFRVDVIWHMVKDEEFRDNPPNPDFQGHNPYHEFLETHTTDQPEVHDVISEMRAVLDEYPARMMVGEIYLPVERLVTYYGEGGEGVHMPFNFQLVTLPWNAAAISKAVNHYEAALPSYGWPNWVLGNHDQSRIASRVGDAQARVAAVLLLTLRGTPTMYFGDEIGMHDGQVPPDRVRDPAELNVPGKGLGRDPQRTPMHWNGEPKAGFTTGDPWLPIAADHDVRNVELERDDATSILTLYRELIALRRREPALSIGAYQHVSTNGGVFAFQRSEEGRRFLIVLNFGSSSVSFQCDHISCQGRIAVDTHLDRKGNRVEGTISLRGDEAVVVELG